MNGEELKKLVPRWVEKVGYDKARRELVLANIAPSTAAFLMAGTYASTPKGSLSDKLKLAMKDFLAELAAS